MKYRNKPKVIEAMQCTPETVDDVAVWCGGQVIRDAKPSDPTDVYIALRVPTLVGVMTAETHGGGDYVVRDVNGGFYPVKPDTFEATYEPVEDV